jgi:TRAP transporter 4TM/12TM fusion protein
VEVIKHAFLPAIISYIALVYIVHLEAVKADMQGLPKRPSTRTLPVRLLIFLFGFLAFIILAGLVLFFFSWIPSVLGAATGWVSALILFAAYVALLWYAAGVPDLKLDDPDAPIGELPDTKSVLRTGLHFLLPIVVLVYALMVLRLSPGLSAFWATVFMVVILVTQRPLKAMFRGESAVAAAVRDGIKDLLKGLESGARNMIGIGVAVAAAGIIVGVVTYTSVGLKLSTVIEALSFGSLFIILLWTAVLCIVLGLGLPTTANYIVVSAIMAPIIVTLGQQNGLIVPLIAVHLFVFYFGILADDTPPVGLAAFAAAAVSKGDPIKTGIQGFAYDIRTAVLPFMFIFNTDLLLIEVTWLQGIMVFVVATIAILIFAAATQGWFFAKNRWYETVALLLIALTLFRPGLWMDMLYEPYKRASVEQLFAIVEKADPGDTIRLRVKTETNVGRVIETFVEFRITEGKTAAERLKAYGIVVVKEDGKYIVDQVVEGSTAKKKNNQRSLDEIQYVLVENDQPPKELFFIPALLLIALIIFWQRRRNPPAKKPAKTGVTATA